MKLQEGFKVTGLKKSPRDAEGKQGLSAMNVDSPARSPREISDAKAIARKLKDLIGSPFQLTGKTRTDGARMRRTVPSTLVSFGIPAAAAPGSFHLVPPKGKGLPGILIEAIDSFLVTSGRSYNLQVGNRYPASGSVLVQYRDGGKITCADVRFVLTWVDPNTHRIRSILVLSPEYIEEHFGPFGKPTLKHQMIVSPLARERILACSPPILFDSDDSRITHMLCRACNLSGASIKGAPESGRILVN